MKNEITLREARRIVQVGKKATPEHILVNYGSMVSQGHIPEDMTKDDVTEAKNVLLRSFVDQSVAEKGFFEIKAPFDDPCSRCHGTGEIYKLKREEVEHEHCEACDGEGFVWIPCRKCNATGRFIKEEKGLKINVECKACKRFENEWPEDKQYHYRVRCRDCRGADKKAKLIGLESTTPCPKCKQIGFFPKQVSNPALPFGSLAQAIEKIDPEEEIVPVKDRVTELQSDNQAMIEKLFAEESE
jgi:hypothetical protein